MLNKRGWVPLCHFSSRKCWYLSKAHSSASPLARVLNNQLTEHGVILFVFGSEFKVQLNSFLFKLNKF